MNKLAFFASVIFSLLFAASCSEDPDVVVNIPSIEILTPTNLLRTSVTLQGQLSAFDNSSISKVSILVNDNSDFTGSTVSTYTTTFDEDGSFLVDVTGLEAITSYFYQASVSNGYDTITSSTYSFTTALYSGVLFDTLKLIDASTNTVSVEIEDDGGSDITSIGFCWSTEPNPTIYDSLVTLELQESSSVYSASLDQLSDDLYYVRAFAENDPTGDGSSTVSYSDEISFEAADGYFINSLSIPDANFKDYLVENFDTNGNGEISSSEAEAVTEINANELEISSLEGIEYFVNLTFLSCHSNLLTSLDVSKNVELTTLYCQSNKLTTLDIAENVGMTDFACGNNQLTSLDLSKNFELKYLYCHTNQLTTLDLSKNVELQYLYCYSNQLTSLDLSNNVELTQLDCYFNSYLYTIYVWEGFDENNYSNFYKDTQASYVVTGTEYIESIEIPDANFKAYLVENFDTNGNGKISTTEAETAIYFSISNYEISSLEGIEYFVNLKYLYCHINQLTTLDLSKNVELIYLNCRGNLLTTLDVSKNVKLTYLSCYSNQLTSLDVSENTEITYLNCSSNQLTSLDVSNNVKLTELTISNNQLTTIDLSNNIELTKLYCYNNQLTSLDISANTLLTAMGCTLNADLYTVYVWDGFNSNNYSEFTKESHTSYVVAGS